jgi:hypothetical protein
VRSLSLSLSFFSFSSVLLDLFFREATTWRIYLNREEDFSLFNGFDLIRVSSSSPQFCETTDVARARVSSRFFTSLSKKNVVLYYIARSDLIIDPIID